MSIKSNNPLSRIVQARYAAANQNKAEDLSKLSLFEFIQKATPGFVAPIHFAEACAELEQVDEKALRFCFSGPPRHGKAVADDTPMPTARGWLRADQVVEGDYLYGSDGKFTKVTGVFPQGEVDLYEIQFSDAARLTVCGEHRWSVKGRYSDKWHTKKTTELIVDLRESDSRKKWRIPITAPVEGLPVDLPLDPYILGVWLGDGTSRNGSITTMDAQIRDALDSVYGVTSCYNSHNSKASAYYSSGLNRRLKTAGLLRNKHVPDVYKTAPAKVRLAVLQGLADTDGTVAKNGSQQSICTTLPRLRDDIAELVSSLGGTYTVVEKETGYKLAYNIYFRLPGEMEGFQLKRKQDLLSKPSPRNAPRRFIDSITPKGRGLARCFAVDAEDHLFCAGRDYVVTHNSELMCHFVALYMLRHPNCRVAYLCYNADLSELMSSKVQEIIQRCGKTLDNKAKSKHFWRVVENGSTLLAVGPSGGFIGRGADLIILDDPYTNRQEAESEVKREAIWNWFASVAFSRLEPGGSMVVTHQRWHMDDIIGRLKDRPNYRYMNIPAINADGVALWPERYNLEALKEIEATQGPYNWASMYMGEPRPAGGAVFSPEGIPTYSRQDLEEKRFKRWSIGIDCAYTKKTYSDYSAAVVIAETDNGEFWLLDVLHKQCSVEDFADDLKRLRVRYPGGIYWYVGGQEKAIAENVFRAKGLPIKDMPAREDKFARAQAAAGAWNTKRIRIPNYNPPWFNKFFAEVLAFTGLGDLHDDQVDAFAAAHHPFAKKHVKRGMITDPFLPF